MPTSEELAALVNSESARMLEYFKTLSPDDWRTQSACDAWNNADVVAHMTMAVDMFSGNIERGANGDFTPPEGMAPPEEFDLAGRMAANAARAVSMRESLGDTLVEAFSQNCDRLADLLARMGPEDWNKRCYHPAAYLSVRRYLLLRLAEMTVHEWDIRSRLEGSTTLPENVAPALIELLPGFVVGRFFLPGSGIAAPTRFRFNLTDYETRDIIAGGGELHMEPSTSGPADVTFTCSSSTFALLAYGRIALQEAVAAGDITIDGDRDLAAQF